MGQSPSADVYWGYDLGDLTDYDTWDSLKPAWMEGSDREWEEELAARLGWQEVPFPEDICPERPSYSMNRAQFAEAERQYKAAEEVFQGTSEYKAWLASRREMRRLVENYPVELSTYGNLDEPGYCVRIKASVQQAWDWGSIKLEPRAVGEDWEQALQEFTELMELPTPKEPPCWHLNCSYG
jgi:hypothetical protein